MKGVIVKNLIWILLFVVVAVVLWQLPFLLKVFRWLVLDAYRFFTQPHKVHLYGIWLYCGLYGQGKTMALTEYLVRMRRKYGDKIYISTNYGFTEEDFPLTTWKDLLTEYDRPVIFGYDEIQNEFNSRDYKNFPYELVKLLTQNRKGNGKQIVGTAQRFGRVDKTIRELCTHVIECRKAWFGRVTKEKKYDVDDYEQMLAEIDVMKKRKVPCSRYRFIQTDSLRNAYDSFKMLDSARTKEYVSASEKLAQILASASGN
jgi:ATP-dependent Clp protease ATP-binding subunit ClpX